MKSLPNLKHCATAGGVRGAARSRLVLPIFLVWFLSLGLISAVSAEVLIESGSPMRYLANTTDPVLGTTWADEVFVDTAWTTGTYGVGYEDDSPGGAENLLQTTVIPGAYSVYTRASFNITDVTAVDNLFLGVDYDDGYIAWINGVEVYRSNEMPAGVPDWNTNVLLKHESSNGAVPDYDPLHDITALGEPALHNGTNILAIGIWNLDAPGSSDLVLVPRLSTNESLTVTRGPYLQKGTATGIIVRWRTNSPTDSRVSYGDAVDSLTTNVDDATLTTEHRVELSGLSPDTQYYYSIGTTTQTLAGNDADHFFVTSPVPGTAKPTRVWILGDSGSADANSAAVRDSYTSLTGTTHTDLWLMLGDNAYPDGTDEEYQDAVFDSFPDMLKKSVLWPTRGNHDLNFGFPAHDYYDIFSLPQNGEAGGTPSGTESYYSFDYGNIHFICLNAFDEARSATGPMMTWLEQDLANTSQHWIIAFWHHPPYSKGRHDSDSDVRLIEMRENALPILEDYGVDLVLCGHNHNYERSYLIDGHYGLSTSFDGATMLLDGGDGSLTGDGAYEKFVNEADYRGAVYTAAGSSGMVQGTPEEGATLDHPVMAVNHRSLGSVVLEVNNNIDELNARFIDDTGAELDNFTIIKNSCATTDEVCNGIDADCDGTADEDFVPTASTCGVGACAGNTGQITDCQEGTPVDTCDPFAGAASDDATCNGIDDDCDGLVDEDCLVSAEAIIDFGSPYGVWANYNDSLWEKLHPTSSKLMAVGNLDDDPRNDVVMDFEGSGLWIWFNDSTWSKLHSSSSEMIVIGDLDGSGRDDVIVDFGSSSTWVWYNNTSWTKLHPTSPALMATGDMDGNGKDEAILDFGASGIWTWYNDTSWSKLHPESSGLITTADMDGSGKAEVIIDFGASGIWIRYNDASWVKLHAQSPQIVTAGDMDGNGKDELVVDFGASGTWVRYNNATWVKLHSSSPDIIAAGDMDGSGRSDIVFDFGASGLWIWQNDAMWKKLHSLSADSILTGDLDGN